MRIEELNALPAQDAVAALRPCVAIEAWAEALVRRRPYAGVDALLAAGADEARRWTHDDVGAALADHPRIGERHQGSSASAAHSSREQAGVGDDPAVRARLAEGNRRYEERFGHIYLVRAAGRSADELLALLEERLTHAPDVELDVTRDQLAEIALLRLEALVTTDAVA